MSARTALDYAERKRNVLFAGTSVALNELDEIFVNDFIQHGFRPAMPLSYDFEQRRMVPHDERKVVCVTTLARIALFKALFHPDHHKNLKRVERRCGWTPGAYPHLFATRALIRNVKEQGNDLRAYVAGFRMGPPFYQWPPFQPHQYRSTTAVIPDDMIEIRGARDFVEQEIDIVEPYPDIHVTDAKGNGLKGCICSGCAL